MFKIIKTDGTVLGHTAAPIYIHRAANGSFAPCAERDAVGISFNGSRFDLVGHSDVPDAAGTVVVRWIDDGELMDDVQSAGAQALEAGDEALAVSSQTMAAARLTVRGRTDISDADALTMPDVFYKWEDVAGTDIVLAADTIINKDGRLYRAVQSTNPQSQYPPDGDGMLAIYRPIDPAHSGDANDPIPFIYGMDCTEGLYYSFEGSIWLCKANMIPCVLTPGTAGIWQWEQCDDV